MNSIDSIRAMKVLGSVPEEGQGLSPLADNNLYGGSDFSRLLQSARPLSSDALLSLNPVVNDQGGVSALQSISDTLQIDKMKMLGMLLKGASSRDPVDNLKATIKMSDMDMQSRVTSKIIGKTVSAITQLSEPK